ncbi:MAG TPA: hypothetical protein VGX97_08290 [bacterium]|nr:hypothetical protein [bacterium]
MPTLHAVNLVGPPAHPVMRKAHELSPADEREVLGENAARLLRL